jgi:hypothetical protein
MNNIFKRKKKVGSEAVAKELFEAFINDEKQCPKHPSIDSAYLSKFEQKMFLYRFALVIMVLLSMEEKEPGFARVIPIVESYIYPPSPTEEALLYVKQTRNAMQDLNALITRQDRPTVMELIGGEIDPKRGVNQMPEFSFAWAWLHDIGIDESNPANFTLFAYWWMQAYVMVVRTVKDIKPI